MNQVNYLTDEQGHRTAVVIPLEGNQEAVEDFLEDLYGREIIRRRRKEPTISKAELLKRLQNDPRL